MELNQELYKKIDKLLSPLFKKVLDNSPPEEQKEINKQIVANHISEGDRVMKLYVTVSSAFLKMKEIQTKERIFEDYELPHFLNYEYLILTEGVFAKRIDLICYFLVKSGIGFEYCRKGKKKYRVTIKQIQKAYLSEKLDFIENNGFDIFWDYYDSKLRNAIAHVNYDVNYDGTIVFKGNKLTIDQFQQKIFDLMDLCYCIHELLKKYYQKYGNHNTTNF